MSAAPLRHVGPDEMRRAPNHVQERRRRPGGRSARVVSSVLDATIFVLARAGYGALTFEAVAGRAGVARTTLYRRWSSKRALVRASLLRLCEAGVRSIDTGSLRGDLREIVAALLLAGDRQRTAAIVSALTAEYEEPELSVLLRIVRERAGRPLLAIVERAVARGELPEGVDPALVVEPLLATLHFRRVMHGDASVEFAERLLELVVAGARALGPAGLI